MVLKSIVREPLIGIAYIPDRIPTIVPLVELKAAVKAISCRQNDEATLEMFLPVG
jgi:hypothetical protein